MIKYSLLIASSLLLSSPTLAEEPAELKGFSDWAENARQNWNIPGFAVAIVKDGKTVFAKGFGVRSMRTGEPFKADTVTNIGSTTKAYVAVALAMLIDEGKLNWDDKVIDHMPNWRVKDAWVTRETNIRDILSHRTGYRLSDTPWYRGLSEDQSLKAMASLEQVSSMRTEWAYNNLNFLLAGKIVEKLSGLHLGKFIKKRIWQPLGMKDSFYKWSNIKDHPRRADAHGRAPGEKPFTMPFSNIELSGGAGMISSTVVDHAKWLALFLNKGKVGDKQLVAAKHFDEMFTPHTIMPNPIYPAAKMSGAKFTTYGLAWFVQDYEGRKIAMHTGSIGGLNAINAVMPEEGIAMVALFNRSTSELRHAAMYEILDRFTDGHSGRDWSGDIHKIYSAQWKQGEAGLQAMLDNAKKGTTPSHKLDSFTGTYSNPVGGDVTLSVKNSKLFMDAGPFLQIELRHFQYDSFLAYNTLQPKEGALTGIAQFNLNMMGQVQTLNFMGHDFKKK